MTLRPAPFANPLRQTLIGLLALVVALTSSQMVTARAEAAAVDRIVICSGYGVMTVDVDAEGNPVGPMHLCPECVAAHLTGVLPGPVLQPPVAMHPVAFAPPATITASAKPARRLRPDARAPPSTFL